MRIIKIIKESDPRPLEIVGTVALLLFSYTLLRGNPHIFASSLTFTMVIKTFSEAVWGSIFLALGVIKTIAIETGNVKFRQVVSTLVEMLWLIWFVLIMLSPVWGFISGVTLLFFSVSTWVFIRLSLSLRDEIRHSTNAETRKEELLKDL